MNAIILRKHLSENRGKLVPTNLSLSLAKPKKVSNMFGLLETGKEMEIVIEESEKFVSKGRPFLQVFQDYCEKTIYS